MAKKSLLLVTYILKRMDKLKKAKNVFKKLIKYEKSMFYAVDRISRLLLGKAKKIDIQKG